MPASLADWLTHLESLHPKTIALGLERVAQVKQRLDLQPDFPVIIDHQNVSLPDRHVSFLSGTTGRKIVNVVPCGEE